MRDPEMDTQDAVQSLCQSSAGSKVSGTWDGMEQRVPAVLPACRAGPGRSSAPDVPETSAGAGLASCWQQAPSACSALSPRGQVRL